MKWWGAALSNGLKDSLAYRVEFLLEFVGSAIVPALIQILLWYAVFVSGDATTFAGATYKDLMAYTVASVLFSQVRGGDHDFEIAELIRNGQLSNYLLRPVSLIQFIYLRGIAPRILFSSVCLVVGILVGPLIGIAPLHMVAAMLLAFLGNLIHYQVSVALSTVAFYWEEAYSVLMVKNLVVSILSGELIPLFLVPEQWSWVWKMFPFHLYVFAPAQFALGKMSWGEFANALALCGGWLVFGVVAIRISWALGNRKYISLGG